MNRSLGQGHARDLVAKLIRLSEATEFTAERDTALQMAWKLAVHAGIWSIPCDQYVYTFDRAANQVLKQRRRGDFSGRRR